MALRTCDGSSSSGLTATGMYCSCGARFEDDDREVKYPHGLTSSAAKPYTYNYYGTLPSNLLSSHTAWPLNVSTAPSYSLYPNPLPPNRDTFEKADLEQLAAAFTTVIKPGDKVIICVDNDVTTEQIAALAKMLDYNAVTGLIVRGARAGTGFPPSIAFPDPKDKRLDTMARILDCWEQRPDVRLAQLLSWFTSDMGALPDEDFAAATEVHFKKVFGGIHGENK